MENDRNASGRTKNTDQGGGQGPGREDSPEDSEGPEMSRRDALKKGAYAAPAIMAIGSVPSFANAGSPCGEGGRGPGGRKGGGGSGSGRGPRDCSDGRGPDGEKDEGHSTHASGHSADHYGNSNHAGGDYGNSGDKSSGSGSGGYGSSDYGSDVYGDSD